MRYGPEMSSFNAITELFEKFSEARFEECLKKFIELKKKYGECVET